MELKFSGSYILMQSSGYRHLGSFESMKIEGAEKCSHKYLLEIIWLVKQHNK